MAEELVILKEAGKAFFIDTEERMQPEKQSSVIEFLEDFSDLVFQPDKEFKGNIAGTPSTLLPGNSVSVASNITGEMQPVETYNPFSLEAISGVDETGNSIAPATKNIVIHRGHIHWLALIVLAIIIYFIIKGISK